MRRDGGRGLHVLMTADAVGGVFTYAVDLAAGLAASGVAVTLAVSGPAPTEAQRWAVARAGAALVELDAVLDWTARAPADLRAAARSLGALAASLRPDVVHLNSPALAAEARFEAPVLGVCHSCLATWWAAVKGGPPPEEAAWRVRAAAAGAAACDALVAPSHAFAAATARAYGIPAPGVIRNARAAPPAAGPKEPFVLTAGRLWDEGKDIATLDRAAARGATRFVALGPLQPPDGPPLRFDALETPGALDPEAVAAFMGRAPVFVSAALYEPFGLAVLEAASAGAALVLSDIPTFRELWDGAALFVEPGDASGFARAVGGLMASPARCAAAGAAAREAAARHALPAMTEAYRSLYGRLAAARHPEKRGAPA